jgi:hypothetical protein
MSWKVPTALHMVNASWNFLRNAFSMKVLNVLMQESCAGTGSFA